jgi:hypothetical protein
LSFLYSCIDDDFALGKESLKGSTRIVDIDTCTAVIKTVWEDSIITAGLGYTWAGEVKDSIFGTTTAISYLPFRLPSVTRQDYYEFDSINFKISYFTDYCGDTSQPQKFSLYRLKRDFSETDDNYCYYNTQSVPMDLAHPILQNFSLNPKGAISTKKQKILTLPAELGEELLNKFMKEEDLDVKDDKSFANYFSGLALKPETGNNLISSFSAKADSDICIVIYYHYFSKEKDMTNDVDKTDATISIVLNRQRQFSQVLIDRKGTRLESISSKKHDLYSGTNTNHQVYIQSLTGLSVEMEFPYLKDLNLLGQNVGILGVKLVLRPIKGTYSKEYPLPDSLSLIAQDQSGETRGTTSMKLNKDDMNYGMNADYEIDITSFFKDQLKAFGIDKKKIKFGNKLTNYNRFLRRAVLADDQKNFNDRLKTEIKLIIYAD